MHQTCQGSHLYSKTSSQTTIKALWNTIICNSKGNGNYFVILEDLQPSKEILKFPLRYLRLIKRKTKYVLYQNLNDQTHFSRNKKSHYDEYWDCIAMYGQVDSPVYITEPQNTISAITRKKGKEMLQGRLVMDKKHILEVVKK